MRSLARGVVIALAAISLAGCVSPPAPKYQASIDNTERILRQRAKLAVGPFTAAAGVENRSLGMRGSQLKGGSDGTFSTYLRDAVIAELQTASGYDAAAGMQLTGVLTRNEMHAAGIKTGWAAVGAQFVLTHDGRQAFAKSLVAEHHWDSSFIGAIAITSAIDNYATTVQKLLGELFSDPDFIAALHAGNAGR